MDGYRPYPAYKDSGIAWLGEIPAHWEVRRLKFVAIFVNTKLERKPPDKVYLGLESIESGTGKVLSDSFQDNVEGTVSVFKTGDVLFGKLRPYLAKVVHADFDGVGTVELLVLRPICQIIESRYLFYLLLSHNFISVIDSMTYGAKMPRANSTQIGNLPGLLPPLSEQRAIAAFLDRETAHLDALIAKKRELIALLRRQRTAIISHAVTKGLDPSAPLKESGVEWLGEIPAHWETRRLKFALERNDGGVWGEDLQETDIADGETGVIVLRSTEINLDGSWNLANPARRKLTGEELRKSLLRAGDILITKSSGSEQHLGKSAFVTKDIEDLKCAFSNFMQRLRVLPNYDPKYIFYLLNCDVGKEQLGYWGSTTTGLRNLNASIIGEIYIPHAPLSEQRAIAAYLDRETARIDRLIEKIEESIALLQQQRTALISAAVTGKIKV